MAYDPGNRKTDVVVKQWFGECLICSEVQITNKDVTLLTLSAGRVHVLPEISSSSSRLMLRERNMSWLSPALLVLVLIAG